jgi:hypothetical protein
MASAAIFLLAGCAVGQEASRRSAFEVATIEPSDPNSGFPPQVMAMIRDAASGEVVRCR